MLLEKAMTSIIWREYFSKLSIRYGGGLLGGGEFDLSYCRENARDSSLGGQFGPVITSSVAARNQNSDNSGSNATHNIPLYFESMQTA